MFISNNMYAYFKTIALHWYCTKPIRLNPYMQIACKPWKRRTNKIGFDTKNKLVLGSDCSGVHYGNDVNVGLPWSDQTCALLNGPVTGIRVWGMPSDGWVRGWVFWSRSYQCEVDVKFEAIHTVHQSNAITLRVHTFCLAAVAPFINMV